jgi:hypothetical protein
MACPAASPARRRGETFPAWVTCVPVVYSIKSAKRSAHICVDIREQFGIRDDMGFRSIVPVQLTLLVIAVMRRSTPMTPAPPYSIVNIFRYTLPHCSHTIPAEAPTLDPPLNPSRGPSPGAGFTPRLRPDPGRRAPGAERHRHSGVSRERLTRWCGHGLAISHAPDPGRQRAGAPRPPAGAAGCSC